MRLPGNQIREAGSVGLADWRATIGSQIVPLQIDEVGSVPFRGRLKCRQVEDISVFEITATPHVVSRTEELIRRGDGRYYKLSLQLCGDAVLEQDERRADLCPGDLAIYDTHRPYRLTFIENSLTMVVVFPHELVDLPRDEIAEVTAIRFPADQGLGKVINPFFIELARNMEQVAGVHGGRLVRSALDLLVTMLSQHLQPHQGSRTKPARSLAREVREYVLAHLADPTLTPPTIAQAHYISTRHLYTIFSTEGQSISAWIRSRRLEHIRRDLADPVWADRPVSAVAARWGLLDAAHFSRVFKAEFMESPSVYRERLLATPRPI